MRYRRRSMRGRGRFRTRRSFRRSFRRRSPASRRRGRYTLVGQRF